MVKQERRAMYPRSEAELYALPDIDSVLQKERRQDELERLRMAKEQRRTWLLTVIFCALFNAMLVGLGLWGVFYP